MTPDARTWMNLGRELSIREIEALDLENRCTDWVRIDAIRERAILAADGGIGWDALRARTVMGGLVVLPR